MIATHISAAKKISIKIFKTFKSFKFKVDKIIVSFSTTLSITIIFNYNIISNRYNSLIDASKLEDLINSEKETLFYRIRSHERDLIYLLKRVHKY